MLFECVTACVSAVKTLGFSILLRSDINVCYPTITSVIMSVMESDTWSHLPGN